MNIRVGYLRKLIREAIESSVVDTLVWNVKDLIFDRHEDLESFRDEAESLGIVGLGDLVVNISKMDPRVTNQRSLSAIRAALEYVSEKNKINQLKSLINKWLSGKGGVEGGKIFGDIAFADQRKNVAPESNTEIEQEVWEDMKLHTGKNIPIKTRTSRALRGVLQRDLYSDVLREPEVEYVYRGLRLNLETLENMLGRALADEEIRSGSSRTNFVMSPRATVYSDDTEEGSTSWTVDLNVARKFSEVFSDSYPYATILVAKVSQNPDQFIIGPDGYYKIKGWDPYTYEKEATALGPVRVYKIYWQYKEDIDSYAEDQLGYIGPIEK